MVNVVAEMAMFALMLVNEPPAVPGPVVPIVLGLFRNADSTARGAGGIHRHSGIPKDAPFCSTRFDAANNRCRTDVVSGARITEEWSRPCCTSTKWPDAPVRPSISNVARPREVNGLVPLIGADSVIGPETTAREWSQDWPR